MISLYQCQVEIVRQVQTTLIKIVREHMNTNIWYD